MEIVNIVASGSFNQKVDLVALRSLGDIYSFDPEMYHGGYVQLSVAKATIYRSGKYIIPGIKAIDMIKTSWDELVSILTGHLDTSLFTVPVISNLVAKDDFGMNLPLAKIQTVLAAEGSEYEPEVFPGLMWSTEFGSANIFQNGKFMVLGCKSLNDLEKLDNYILKRLGEIIAVF